MTIPKSLIIGIYLHGEYHFEDVSEKINEDVVPNKMHIAIINAVAPGVPNISTLKNYENMASQISNEIKQVKNYNKLTNLSTTLRDLLVNINENPSKEIIKNYHHSHSIHQSFKSFVYHYDNSFNIKTFDANETIPNKLFIKFIKGEIKNPHNIPEKYFNHIVLHNLDGEPDLFDMLKSSGLNINQISLVQILEFLVHLGVENLLIVDLSCAIFVKQPRPLTERHVRQLRRHMICH